MRRRTLPVLVSLLVAISAVSACSDGAAGPLAPVEGLSNTEGQGFGNVEGQGFGNSEAADSAATTDGEGQGFGN